VRLGFVVTRLNQIRHAALLIEEALARGLDVTLFLDHSGRRAHPAGLKGYVFPRTDAIPVFRHGQPRLLPYATLEALFGALRARPVDVLFGARPILPELTAAFVDERPLITEIQTAWDSLMLHIAPDTLDSVDAFYGFSEASVDWWVQYQIEFGRIPAAERDDWRERLRARFVTVGFAAAEQFKCVDPKAVRARLRLPPGRPVVLYLPFPFQTIWREFWPHRVHHHRRPMQFVNILLSGRWRWLPYALRGWNDPALVTRLRKFCDRSGAALVVKARRKHPVSRHLARQADLTLYDDSFYPATIVELMSVASLVVHYYSFGLVEAAYGGVPSVCISPSGDEWPKIRVQKMGVTAFSGVPDSFYNFAGVVHRLTIPEAFTRLPALTLADFPLHAGRRRAFLQQFFGHDDLDVAARILADLERRVARRPLASTPV
jgi:hypothetical protein